MRIPSMHRGTRRILLLASAVAALAVLLPGTASAQRSSGNNNCVLLEGNGDVTVSDGGTCSGELFVTLTGSLEIVPEEATDVQVACWICESGSCDSFGPYGPATWTEPLVLNTGEAGQPTFLDWSVSFNRLGGWVPDFSSYSCEVRVAIDAFRSGISGSSLEFTVPDPFAPDPRVRPADGTSAIIRLEGSLPSGGM